MILRRKAKGIIKRNMLVFLVIMHDANACYGDVVIILYSFTRHLQACSLVEITCRGITTYHITVISVKAELETTIC